MDVATGEQKVSIKTYGVERILWKGKPRWAVRSNGETIPSLNYARREFALKKAEGFTRRCYRDHVGFQGVEYKFQIVPE